MAGINRLGKGPARASGVARPPDPNRRQTIDCFSEQDAQDPDYLRAVHEIEEQTGKQGWLYGRGAFDKGDLLYLRDQEEKQRHMELEQKESEAITFARLRARVEAEAAAPPIATAPPSKAAATAKKPPSLAVKPVGAVKPVVKVKPKVKARENAVAPDSKRLKTQEGFEDGNGRSTEVTGVEHEEPAGLPGLLGDYGSSDEDD